MYEKSKIQFPHFLSLFPEIELPITLGTDSHFVFSKKNDPLPALAIQQYLLPTELEEVDDMTEFVPCFRLSNTYDIHAVVYWKAGLLNYQYILLTFTKQGVAIDKKVIAGTFSDGELLTQSVATIDEDWTIHVVSGQQGIDIDDYDASSSRAFQLELLPEGNIIESE
ncbi:MAG: hypothetical protein AAF798_03425 [Bacteroidota bacterium]